VPKLRPNEPASEQKTGNQATAKLEGREKLNVTDRVGENAVSEAKHKARTYHLSYGAWADMYISLQLLCLTSYGHLANNCNAFGSFD
jgi:hypothetical protein